MLEKRRLARANGVEKKGKMAASTATTTKLVGRPAVGAGAIEWVPRPPKESKSLLSRLFSRDK